MTHQTSKASTGKKPRVFWTEQEWDAVMAEAKRLLDETGLLSPDEAQKVLRPARHRPLSGHTSHAAVSKFKAIFRKRYGTTNAAPRADARKPGLVSVSRPPTTAPLALGETPAAQPAAATVDSALGELTSAAVDRIEDAAVDLLVSIVDRTLSHPAVVRALHALVQSAFTKEVETTLDKAAPWSEKTVLARLTRVLVVGLNTKEQERATELYGQTLAMRFWDEKQQSKGLLKQLVYGSQRIVVLPGRIGHSTMQLIKSRAKQPPVYVNGYGAAAIYALEEIAKQAIVDSTVTQ